MSFPIIILLFIATIIDLSTCWFQKHKKSTRFVIIDPKNPSVRKLTWLRREKNFEFCIKMCHLDLLGCLEN